MRFPWTLYWILVATMSFIAFAAYGWDKRQAKRDARRIPEQTLHAMAFAGGWPGAWIGQQWFRHKTQKVRFRVVFWCAIIAHVGLVYLIVRALQAARS